MASFRKIGDGKTAFDTVDETQLKLDDMVSYYNHLMGIRKHSGPVVRFSYRTAKGTAYYSPNVPGIGYEIRVNGMYKDVRVVIKKFENFFGATDLNPNLGLPDNLKAPIERIKYLINWIKTGKN
jgi:hypothetical protein